MKLHKNSYLLALLLSPYLTFSQVETGVRFEADLNWQEVLAKAAKEKKFIFLDIYATWCGPCKQMDKFVYTDTAIGDFFNKQFISIKVQMDTSKNDNGHVREWYSDAHELKNKYR